MLEGTSDSIQSISDALAFGNRSYFYTCFRKQMGISPSEYRKKYGKL
ncbi:MAG: AraC family transcriptional regulator [Lachnospiraceae bacterium]|nr:AraC family transcriptional regulator [Lachnospiraceae bacterium]